MSFADWATDTGSRLREEPPKRAIGDSLQDFVDGLRSRAAIVEMLFNDGIVSSPLHEDARFHAESRQDLRRAKTLCGEAAVYNELQEYLHGGTILWDVGGYHGHYSILAALEGSDVVTFEPVRTNRMEITRNARLNSVDIDLREVALSDRERITELRGHSRSEAGIDANAKYHRGQAQLVRGDDIGPWPDVVKIDVEGHEPNVLDGMRDILGGVTAIAIEVHDGVDEADIEDRLERAGLRVREPDTTRRETHLLGVRD